MKRIISALLVAVMLFGLVPFSNAAKTVLGTEASALETVDGSFEYLKKLIYKHGKADVSGNIVVDLATLSGVFKGVPLIADEKLVYNISRDEIQFGAYDSVSYTSGMLLIASSYIAIRNNYNNSIATIHGKTVYEDLTVEADFDPTTYYLKKPLDYKIKYNGIPSSEKMPYETSKLYDNGFSDMIEAFNTILKNFANISLGNFGFTKIANPIELPSPNKTYKEFINYKRTATFSRKPETVTDGIAIRSIEYKSSDTSVITVDENGSMYSVGRGEAVVTRTITDVEGNVYTDTYNMTVGLSFFQWLIWIFLLGFLWY